MILTAHFNNGGLWDYWTKEDNIDKAIDEFIIYANTIEFKNGCLTLFPTSYWLVNETGEIIDSKIINPKDDKNWIESGNPYGDIVSKDYPKVDEDLKLAIAGWWCAADDEWVGDGDAFDWIEETGILDRNNLTREDIMKSIPKEWTT